MPPHSRNIDAKTNVSPEEPTVRAKLAHRYRVPLLEVESLEPLPGVLVPEVEISVRSGGREGSVLVERDGVHRINRRLRGLHPSDTEPKTFRDGWSLLLFFVLSAKRFTTSVPSASRSSPGTHSRARGVSTNIVNAASKQGNSIKQGAIPMESSTRAEKADAACWNVFFEGPGGETTAWSRGIRYFISEARPNDEPRTKDSVRSTGPLIAASVVVAAA